jgi:hypothetical protein
LSRLLKRLAKTNELWNWQKQDRTHYNNYSEQLQLIDNDLPTKILSFVTNVRGLLNFTA